MDDVNDNAPAIASCDEGMEIHVSEATQTDTEITTFSATDKDKQQIISFSLENERHFNISSSGKTEAFSSTFYSLHGAEHYSL